MPKRIDRDSPEYKRELWVVAVVVTVLTLVGGGLLGYKIDSAEKARQAQRESHQKADQQDATTPTRQDRRVY
ncbi:MAG: hypothetical protein VYE40_10360 [Myxococcota bacterium]|jgi:hypothetical protein|nr:hypothetical protein [Myxococcota bacterium]